MVKRLVHLLLGEGPEDCFIQEPWSFHLAEYLLLLVDLHLPCCLPSHIDITCFPFSHVTVGLGDPLTVQRNFAGFFSFTVFLRSKSEMPAGVGSGGKNSLHQLIY